LALWTAPPDNRSDTQSESVAKSSFPLIISCLSYALSALLRRNIIAFNVGEHPYFAGNSNRRRKAGFERKRKSPAMFANIVRFIREWKRYNQSLSELSRLGDRELADIGISRSDIPRVAWNAAHR
jgi:uncharacterized protein YjiS (DUF1127 family)